MSAIQHSSSKGVVLVSSLKKHIPNALSWSRIVTLGIVIWLIFSSATTLDVGQLTLSNFQIIAILLLLGFLTDIADGLLARLWKVESRFGNILDHVADKLMVLPVIYLLIVYMWGWSLIIWLAMEVMVLGVSVYLLISDQVESEINRWPNWPGKISYVTTAIAMMVMLVTVSLPIWTDMHLVVNMLLIVAILLRVISLRVWFKNR
jgi:phosphatidylglycerophosphate synthase